MKLKKIPQEFSVCKIEDVSDIPFQEEYYFVGKTEEEISLVCPVECVPDHVVTKDDGWRGFRIQGMLDFSLIGILAKISTILAENEIGIFAVSTFNTDYILTKSENYERALDVLSRAGYEIE